MSWTAAEIDRIVREVLRRLPDAVAERPNASNEIGTLDIASRLVTQRDLQGKLVGIKQVAVGERAVVTPAARDFLREAGVTLVREQNRASAAGASSSRHVAALVVISTESTAALAEGIRLAMKQGVEVERLANAGMIDALDELTSQVARGGKLGVLATNETHASLALANRQRGIRAAACRDRIEISKQRASLNANLLILDPIGLAGFAIGQTLIEFSKATSLACPAAYRGRLD